MTFSWNGFRRGLQQTIPLAFSVGAYGLLFGMLAQKAGMSLAETLLMCLTVFAGASQLVATDLWQSPLPVLAIIVTTFVINARHLLMGAALHPWFKSLKPHQAYGSLFFCADENWAFSLASFQKGEKDLAFLAGGGFSIYTFWFTASWIGFTGGQIIPDPRVWGLDFAFTAVFLALLVSLWQGRGDLWPWLVAAVAAVVTHHFLPGKGYILVGAFLGSLVGAWRYGNR
ncbi:MAG: AzlC family ABC transporter permease [Deltaproteobacteria bacterium]|nr:AzlC family ABC transporter permease [Deltaproteobacteria bacterium]